MARKNAEFFDQQELLVRPGPGQEPAYVARQMGCYATLILPILTTLGLAALFLWLELPITMAWLFLAVPASLWVLLLGLPLFYKFRTGSLMAIDSQLATFEAYMSRAGLAIDLNQDGRVGHYTPEVNPVQVEEYRPITLNVKGQQKYMSLPAPMADAATNRVGGSEPIKHTTWLLPNKERCTVDQLVYFVQHIFVQGWSRDVWVGNGPNLYPRDVYDGLCQQLEQGNILEGRKQGSKGKLLVETPQEALETLGLTYDMERGWICPDK